jgi:hypothetical protein
MGLPSVAPVRPPTRVPVQDNPQTATHTSLSAGASDSGSSTP